MGLKENPHPKVLDSYNESLGRLTERARPDQLGEGSYLHATKGYRTVTARRGRAMMITMEQKRGQFPPSIISLQIVRSFVLTGRYK